MLSIGSASSSRAHNTNDSIPDEHDYRFEQDTHPHDIPSSVEFSSHRGHTETDQHSASNPKLRKTNSSDSTFFSVEDEVKLAESQLTHEITSVVDTVVAHAREEPNINAASSSDKNPDSLVGDVLCLISTLFYAVYITMIGKYVHDPVSFFAWVGLYISVAGFPLAYLGYLPNSGDLYAQVFSQPQLLGLLLLTGLLDNVLSQYFWAYGVMLTSPTVATVGLSLTIPLAIVSDLVFMRVNVSWLQYLASCFVCAGFILLSVMGKPEASEKLNFNCDSKSDATAESSGEQQAGEQQSADVQGCAPDAKIRSSASIPRTATSAMPSNTGIGGKVVPTGARCQG